ncbi:hypothetical protein G7Y89_g8952 [Cudoniella acicularis]|uniref:Uncharacterized protein n=1 Tax=Cudoniella acicularis TaxID=354080 RepID=A0A8H4RHW9_9HELO|nr:hypothetical protein G7Y89_g8952 [Cudoniella acicularis]
MGANISSHSPLYLAHHKGSSDHLPNDGISKVFFPQHLSPGIKDLLLIALEHRYYHRYADAEAILLDLLRTVENERDCVQILIHYGMLRIYMGVSAPHEVIYHLGFRLSCNTPHPYPPDPQIQRGAIMNADPVEKGLQPRMRTKVSKMNLKKIDPSEKVLIQMLGIHVTGAGNYAEKERFLCAIFKDWEDSFQSPVLQEHEVWIHFMYHHHIRNFKLQNFRQAHVLSLLERLILEGRYDAALDFHEFFEPHAEHSVKIKTLFLSMTEGQTIKKRQHTHIRMILANASLHIKESHIKGDEIERLMTECNDALYSKVQRIGGYSHRHSGNLTEIQTLDAIGEMVTDTTTMIKLKCFREALQHAKIYTVRTLRLPVWESQFDLSLARALEIQLHRCRDPPEEFAACYKYCVDVAMEDDSLVKVEMVLDHIRQLRARYPLWTATDGTNQLAPFTKYAYEKVAKHGLGMPVAMLAAGDYLATMSMSKPGSEAESKAAYELLLQDIRSIDYMEQSQRGLPAVVLRCQQVEFMALGWIHIDRSKKRFELAFEKAHLISGLAFLDPLKSPNNKKEMPSNALEQMKELMELSPKAVREEQLKKIVEYVEKYNGSFPFHILVNKFMYN